MLKIKFINEEINIIKGDAAFYNKDTNELYCKFDGEEINEATLIIAIKDLLRHKCKGKSPSEAIAMIRLILWSNKFGFKTNDYLTKLSKDIPMMIKSICRLPTTIFTEDSIVWVHYANPVYHRPVKGSVEIDFTLPCDKLYKQLADGISGIVNVKRINWDRFKHANPNVPDEVIEILKEK